MIRSPYSLIRSCELASVIVYNSRKEDSMRLRVVKKALLYALALGLLSAGTAAADGGPHKTRVDCGRGQSLNQALTSHEQVLVVEFTGTCTGDVVVGRSDV